MPRTYPGRDAKSPQHLSYIEFLVDVSIDAAALAVGKQYGTLAIGAKLRHVSWTVEVVLAGGAPALKVGTTTATATELIANSAYAATAIVVPTAINTPAGFLAPLTAETPIYAKETGAATSGKVRFQVFYTL